MLYEIFLITMLGVSFSGCMTFHKTVPKSILIEDKSSKEERVWTEAKTNKVWVNPHVDENGDMVEGHYKHIVMTPGHWAVKEDDGKK